MTTARDLLIVAMDVVPGSSVEPGDLSLALAGAELIDLIDARALTLDGDRIVPNVQPNVQRALPDRLLDEASSSLTRQPPYESVEDWLWRRGRGLSTGYLAVREATGQGTGTRHRWNPLRTQRPAPTDSAARLHAEQRWASDDPILSALATAAGIRDQAAEEPMDAFDDATVTVLAAVNDAVMELEAVRQRRAIEDAAFDNVWRGL